MTTQMFLRSVASDLGGAGQFTLKTTRGAASSNLVTNTTASGTSIQATQIAGGTAVAFFSDQLDAVTLSGTLTVNIRGLESSLSANATAGLKIERCDSTGTVLSTILAEQTIPTSASEYSTSDAAKTQFSLAITSTSLSNGDRIKITLLVKNVGTMGGGFTVTNTIDGPTASAAGDTYVTFTETILSASSVINNFSALTAGTTVSSANTGGASGDAFDAVGTSPHTPVVTANGAHSPVCIAIDNGNATGSSFVQWTGTGKFGVQNVVHFRIYAKISANPVTNPPRLLNITSTSSVLSVTIDTNGKLVIHYGSSDTTYVTFTSAVPIGSWFRIEGFVIISTSVGQVSADMYSTSGMDASTPDETHTSAANLNTGAASSAITYTFGQSLTAAMASAILISDIGLSSTAALGIAKLLGSGFIAMHKMGLNSAGLGRDSATGSIRMHKMGLSASGLEKVSATGSIRMHKMGLSGSGTIITGDSGTGSIRMHKMGLSASGLEKVSATGSIRMHKMGLSGTGLERVSATGSIRMYKMGLSGTGLEKVSATGSVRMHKMGLSGAGFAGDSGTGSVQMHKMGLSASGLEKISATGSIRMHKMHMSVTGTVQNTATGSVHMHKMSILATNIRPHSSNLFIFTAV